MTETAIDKEIEVRSGSARLPGMLVVPSGATGIVVFAHGSGSGRFSPRNQFVASVLRHAGFGTLLMDLLEPDEAEDRAKVFDIDLLAQRLVSATEFLRTNAETSELPIGYFGASTGAAAALQAAAELGGIIRAVVSRGGRPDLAAQYLASVKCPTLLIVGGCDYPIIPLNRQAFEILTCPKELVIVPGATHLFEEPGALEEVARLAADWFKQHLPQLEGNSS
ncbi:MAG: dienelactone hydrolase family protein [Armatimonadota bacterium]|nr:dienelactone hydrolase family protein [Armatimonadota bacterium]